MYNVLITGGTGSVGQAYIDYRLKENDNITVFSRDEAKQYELRNGKYHKESRIRWIIGDVRDIDAIRSAGKRTIGNLREELGKRRVLGSTFASREIASTEAEFGRIEEQSRAESFLQELTLTG